jgi:hypothetical protein
MENLFWMLYITLMLFSTIACFFRLIEILIEKDSEVDSFTIYNVILICLMWAGYIVYFLN